jgi:uncharacterized protein (UPF0335 family)
MRIGYGKCKEQESFNKSLDPEMTKTRKEQPMSEVDTTIITKELEYSFTPDDLLKLGNDMAAAAEQVEALEEEKADFMTGLKDRLGKAQALIKVSGRKIRLGWEMRLIECRQEKDFITNTVRTYRQDTNELVEERAMTIEERQRFLIPETAPEGPEGQEAQRH